MPFIEFAHAAWRLAGYEAEMAEVAMIAIHIQLLRVNGYRICNHDMLWGLTWSYQ